MKPDLLHPITPMLAKMLPDEWKEGEEHFCFWIPLATNTDGPGDAVPRILFKIEKEHFDYIKANT